MAAIDQSLWRSASPERMHAHRFPKDVDVVVIGGGITGLTAAYLLKTAGRTVAVFERERIGAGETGNTSAHLTYVTDLPLTALAKRFGPEAASLVWQGGARAIDLIETNATMQQMACDFQRVPGFHCGRFTGPAADDEALLHDEAALAHQLGFPGRYVNSGPIGGRPAVAFADEAIFHPLKYLSKLARAVDGHGSYVCERAEVGEVLQDPLAVIVNGETVACQDVIIATHVPLAGSTALPSAFLFQTKLYPYSTYVLGAEVGPDAPPPGLYSDTSDPYWYLRIHERHGRRYAILGGADHKTGQESDTESCFAAVERMLRTLLPSRSRKN